ncbi:glycosyltransferase family 2 protein [Paenibacillus sp. PL2-23]|uniref:glycosyltransferase family 2 protein n=1 Tax=Paenibacillus sp. PL2-23 TaxID=2100729 RepID=UPI0030FC4702
MKIAAILTCYNRRDATINCIKKLKQQYKKIDIYVCDDASTDLTSETIKGTFPDVTLIESKGDLYWSKGMYLGMESAKSKKYDFYLMINDDVDFYDEMLETMLTAYKLANRRCGIVGSTRSVDTNELTYGGSILVNKLNINRKKLLTPNGKIQKCDFANWNCFLIDRITIERVGLIDNYYEHALGDYDYSCRMKKHDIPIYVAGNYVGTCERNPISNTYRDSKLSRKKRTSLLLSIKGLPIKSTFRFYYRNYNIIGVPFFIWIYLRIFMSIIFKREC